MLTVATSYYMKKLSAFKINKKHNNFNMNVPSYFEYRILLSTQNCYNYNYF